MATTQFAMAFAPSALMPDQAQALAKRARRKPSKLQENFAATPEVEKRKTKTQRNKKRKSASTRQPRSISHLGCYVPEQPPPRGMTPAAPTLAAPPRENFGNVTERQLRQLMDQTWSAAAIHGTDRVKAMLDALTHTTSPSPGSVPIGPQHGAAGSSNSSAGNTQPPARQQTAHGQHGQPQEGQNYSPAGSAKVIWIMGHSYIYWAHIRTKRKTSSEQMGIPHSKASLFWLGKRGMRWVQLMPCILQYARQLPQPDIICHLGGNDLVAVKNIDLIITIKKDLTAIKAIWPAVVLVWSHIIPRLVWRDARSHKSIEKSRRKLNKEVGTWLRAIKGYVIKHDDISLSCSGMYRPDGVHLSDVGVDIFILALQTATAALVN
ncbi:uncharacterized protein LOC115087134 [Rhinatrema bivittatum]|uniref:uncharacterized protein LOC115087134 n=1 Tax=Rhinatrema bivittatum TaxID=194408 RepID=UPI00112D9356|nr:uncharacterized protein LOC115087134 [Rhinatrema bivittatum]